jgi:pimeloyl-ACP methyl ester carboxylesterase
VILCPEGVGGSLDADFVPPASSLIEPGRARVYGAVSQLRSSWCIASAMGAEVLGIDEIAFVLHSMDRIEARVSEWVRLRTGIAPAGPIFASVVVGGFGLGGLVAAGVGKRAPDRVTAVVQFASTVAVGQALGKAGKDPSLVVPLDPPRVKWIYFIPDATPAPFFLAYANTRDKVYPFDGGRGNSALHSVKLALAVPGVDFPVPLSQALDYVDETMGVREGALRFVLARKTGGVPLDSLTPIPLPGGVTARYNLTDPSTGVLLGQVEWDLHKGHRWNQEWISRMWTTLEHEGLVT